MLLFMRGHVKTEEQIIKLIRKDVKARSENVFSYCDSILNRVLCCNWGIHSSVLRRKMLILFFCRLEDAKFSLLCFLLLLS
jgi:hypothetical protein